MIAALAKAQSLDRHLVGAPRELVCVSLSDREAWELLVWYFESFIQYSPPDERLAFQQDLAQARNWGTPWPMLETFQIGGYHVTRLADEAH